MAKLLELRVFQWPLWIRRVLVRAQEGQLKAEQARSAGSAWVLSSVRAERHQNDGMGSAKAEIHSSLEARTLPRAHLEVRQDNIAHKLSELTNRQTAIARDATHTASLRNVILAAIITWAVHL